MALPPLYKYLDVRGAKLTLGNGTFKHSKPSDFNDVEDLTVQSIFAEETEAALTKLSSGFTDVILQHLNDPPTCNSPMREKVALIQDIFRANPKAAEVVKAEISKAGGKPIYDVEHMRERAKGFLKEINESMQNFRVLCVTTHKNSETMWYEYADKHKGIALRVEPNVAKDSEFQLFFPVEYHEKRPPLYDNPLEFCAEGLFGDHNARIQAALEKIMYSKTLHWQDEGEYRLAIPICKGEAPWNTLKFHPEEVTELYLGLAMTNPDKDEIVALAKALNPEMAIFQAQRVADERLTFSRL